MSRDPSRAREPVPNQFLEHMLNDDGLGSESTSPTSVRTPENDTIDFESLDNYPMHETYPSNGIMVTPHISPQSLSAMDSTIFMTSQGTISDQGTCIIYHHLFANQTDLKAVEQAFNDTLAANPQHFQAHLTMQSQLPQTVSALSSDRYFFGDQTTAPWTSQNPPRNPNAHSGSAVWDLATDQENYSGYVSNDVDFWASHNTDPDSFVSPTEPVAPPLDFFSMTSQSMMRQQQHQQQQTNRHLQRQPQAQVANNSPIEMRVQRASPSPDPHTFVRYSGPSPLFTVNRPRNLSQQLSSVVPSIEQPPRSPFPVPSSPLASASSPGGSESMLSYQHSDPGLELDAYGSDAFHQQPVNKNKQVTSSFEVEPFSKAIPELSFDESPEPENRPARRPVGPIRTTGRPGGRALGTHLLPRVARAAHDMRKIVACWHCVLQRDKVRLILVTVFLCIAGLTV